MIDWIAKLLGYIMNAICWLQDKIGSVNIGLSIILFTVAVYILLIPLTMKQQKFSKLQGKMAPELQAIQKKYKDKQQDNAAMAKMNEETQAVYKKYGASPAGGCLPMLIQMPILLALYRVISNIPAYVNSVKAAFMPLSNKLMTLPGVQEFFSPIAKANNIEFQEVTQDALINVMYKFDHNNWSELQNGFTEASELVFNTQQTVNEMNYFWGLNIAESPLNIIKDGLANGSILLVIGAVLIPLLSFLSQILSTKIMQKTNKAAAVENENPAANTTKTMNIVMPVMSAAFCVTLPVGMGIYWIAGAIVRCIQQVVINCWLDRKDRK